MQNPNPSAGQTGTTEATVNAADDRPTAADTATRRCTPPGRVPTGDRRVPDAPPAGITVSTPLDALEIAGVLLGYEPRDSVVLLGLREQPAVPADGNPAHEPVGDDHALSHDLADPTHDIGVTARLDLDRFDRLDLRDAERLASRDAGDALRPDPAHADLLGVAAALTNAGVEQVIVVCFSADARRARRVGAFWRTYLTARGIGMRDLIHSNGETYATWHDDPQLAVRLPVVDGPVRAAAVLHGRIVLADRDAVRARVEVGDRPVSDRVLRQGRREVGQLVEPVSPPGLDPPPGPLTPLGRLAAQVCGSWADSRRLQSIDVARLAALTGHASARDVFYLDAAHGDAERATDMWAEVCTRVPDAAAAVPAAMLAFAGYLAGAGALVTCALERAIRVGPEHPVVDLVARLVFGAVHPDEVRRCVSEGVGGRRPPGAGGSVGDPVGAPPP